MGFLLFLVVSMLLLSSESRMLPDDGAACAIVVLGAFSVCLKGIPVAVCCGGGSE
eukprot:m.149512 g.149512  ORF g.149512 m.149512 type:complete len:55 (-) comp52775_c0_seq2:24-188(-)